MLYEPPLFRPPSEASSLILQVTLGCSHNACAFCGMYKGKKFRVRSQAEIMADIEIASRFGQGVKRIFLADGNALTMETQCLLNLLKHLYNYFPELERVSCYAGPRDLLYKELDELSELRMAGLKLLYLGVESGSDVILKKMHKGVNANEMIQACRRALDAGFELSVTVITGLGGKEYSREHAQATARVINAINPTYLAALTLIVVPGTPLFKEVQEGKFTLLTPQESLQELKWLIEGLEIDNCLFRCNHASNYLPLRGYLKRDKDKLIYALDKALNEPGSIPLRPDYIRGL
ncbi:B12-binding domain-containing radical SAM protein [Desulfofundulus thermocisternus]|uniref:B12-binding domain-containing radical SAM protein n=1 Tax=Desulfofundulus thermocisternus TaxID=42471 RepID=UPI0019F35241|nr:radical SAM protein [Desulfofundulus thermocisternus]MBE3585061.1 B12-binding domain-containing radical SAM protein [Thermoanaerobacter sp.]MCS5695883.1 B12-binding domain-containing radical SAM protein [Desulfofundulus thermocisternus]